MRLIDAHRRSVYSRDRPLTTLGQLNTTFNGEKRANSEATSGTHCNRGVLEALSLLRNRILSFAPFRPTRGGFGKRRAVARESTVKHVSRHGISRRTALAAAGVAAAGAAAGQLTRVAHAHDLRPTDPVYQFDEYERIVNRDVTIRQVYEWPNINNAIIYSNISNGLNGFHFSYDVPSDRIQVVVQAFASANLAMYDDAVWERYRLGEVFKVQDPATGQPATHNQWFASKNPPLSEPPTDRANPYYSDTSIEGLQRRGVLFLI
jgi:hypothetical protein